MKVLEYLKGQMSDFVGKFKTAKVNYEYDELANLHTIEILPQTLFDSDEFARWESEFFKKAFIDMPNEDISFISDDAYIGLEHVDWCLIGSDYKEDMLDEHISQDDSKMISYSLTLADYEWSCPAGYSTLADDSIDCIEVYKTENQFKSSLVLDKQATVMLFDDDLLQAA